jgi:hypothetical protein
MVSISLSRSVSQAPRSRFVNCRLGFPGNAYEAVSLCYTFRTPGGSKEGVGFGLWSTPLGMRGVANGNGSERCCGTLSSSLCAADPWGSLPPSRRLTPARASSTLGQDGRGMRTSPDSGAMLPDPRMATNLSPSSSLPDLLPPGAVPGRFASSSCSAGMTALPPLLREAADSSLSCVG